MMTSKYLAFFFSFIIFSIADGEDNMLRVSESSEGAHPLQRRYSEAILASDYSRSMENLMKKNFVEWLLNRREKKSENQTHENKRETDFQLPDLSAPETDVQDESERSRNILTWLVRNRHKQSSHPDTDALLNEELLDLLLMTTDLCKLRFT